MIHNKKTEVLNWEYKDPGHLYNQWLKLSNVTIDSNLTFVETNALHADFMPDRQILTGDAAFRLVLTFDFESKLSVTGGGATGKGTLEFISNKFVFTKQEIKQNTENIATANITLQTNYTAAYVTDKDDGFYLPKYFGKIWEAVASEYGRNITLSFQKAIDDFYKEEATTRPKKYQFKTTNPNVSYELDLIYLENPLYDAERGVIYYHSGEVLKPISEPSFLGDPQPNHDKWDNFSSFDGTLQVFLNHHVLLELFNDINDTKAFKFSMNNSNIPANNTFKMDIEHLGIIAPSFYNLYSRDEKLTLYGFATYIDFDMVGNDFKGTFTINFSVNIKETTIFQFSCEMIYALNIAYTNQKLNVELGTWSLSDFTIGGHYGVIDEGTLRTWTQTTIQKVLDAKPYTLLAKDVDFSSQFISSKLIIIPDNGIVIAGEPGSALQNGVPKDFTNVILKTLKDSRR